MPTHKFKVGDRVRFIGKGTNPATGNRIGGPIGSTGTIISVDRSSVPFHVELDGGEPDIGRRDPWAKLDMIKLIKAAPEAPKASPKVFYSALKSPPGVGLGRNMGGPFSTRDEAVADIEKNARVTRRQHRTYLVLSVDAEVSFESIPEVFKTIVKGV